MNEMSAYTCDELGTALADRDAWKAVAETYRKEYPEWKARAETLQAENERIRDLVAIVNRDGGHASVEKAIEQYYSDRAESDQLKAENERLKEALRDRTTEKK